MAAEIAHFAQRGLGLFAALRPFGCPLNHARGRRATKRLKGCCAGIRILPNDPNFDRGVSSVESRPQMLARGEEA